MISRSAAIGAIAACGAWAFWPLAASPVAAPVVLVDSSTPDAAPRVCLDTNAFRAPLWVSPPAPPPPPAPSVAAAPPPSLKLQLIAILREGGQFRAALYDPDADKLTVVGPGDSISGRTVERIGAADLALKDQGLVRTLSLRMDGGRP
jgi:hypothetical protein